MKWIPVLPILLLLFSCTEHAGNKHAITTVNKSASKETIALLNNLHTLTAEGKYLLGHQDDLAYGVNWRYEKAQSDIKAVAGDYPALYGWDLGWIENDSPVNLDSVPFTAMQGFIKEGYERGGVITISWHPLSPLGGGKTSWDTTAGTVRSVLKGNANHKLYLSWLDKIAVFMNGLKGSRGEAIPVIFRPFHEHTGHWFWWGSTAATAEEYIELWKLTYNYLTTDKQLNHLLWAYNTSGNINSEAAFLERYPGDELVDILSFDSYQFDNGDSVAGATGFINEVNNGLNIITKTARDKNKLIALAETGYEAIPDSLWWTGTFSKAIGNYPIAYVLLWRNHGMKPSQTVSHYYAPYQGQVSAEDFKKYTQSDRVVLNKDAEKAALYR